MAAGEELSHSEMIDLLGKMITEAYRVNMEKMWVKVDNCMQRIDLKMGWKKSSEISSVEERRELTSSVNQDKSDENIDAELENEFDLNTEEEGEREEEGDLIQTDAVLQDQRENTKEMEQEGDLIQIVVVSQNQRENPKEQKEQEDGGGNSEYYPIIPVWMLEKVTRGDLILIQDEDLDFLGMMMKQLFGKDCQIVWELYWKFLGKKVKIMTQLLMESLVTVNQIAFRDTG